MLCPHPSLAISRKILLIISFIMFISLNLGQMINFVPCVSLKRRARTKDKRERESERESERRERERGAITHCIQFFICLCSSVSSYNLK